MDACTSDSALQLMLAVFGLAIVGLIRAKRRASLPRQGSARLEDGHTFGEAMTTPKAVTAMVIHRYRSNILLCERLIWKLVTTNGV